MKSKLPLKWQLYYTYFSMIYYFSLFYFVGCVAVFCAMPKVSNFLIALLWAGLLYLNYVSNEKKKLEKKFYEGVHNELERIIQETKHMGKEELLDYIEKYEKAINDKVTQKENEK